MSIKKLAKLANDAHMCSMTSAQKQIWLGQSIAPELPLYNMPFTFHLRHSLEADIIRQAVEATVNESDILRALVNYDEALGPHFYADLSSQHHCPLLDFSAEKDPTAAALKWIETDFKKPLIMHSELLRTAVLKLDNSTSIMYWCVHHLLNDGANLNIIVERMSAHYRAIEQTGYPDINDVQHYFDYPNHLIESSTSESFLKRQQYWEDKTAVALDKPVFYAVESTAGYKKTRHTLELSQTMSEGIKKLVDTPCFKTFSKELAFFNVFACALFVTLFRVASITQIRLGFPYHARRNDAYKKALGMFVEMGFMEMQAREYDTFETFSQRLRKESKTSFMNMAPGISSSEINQAFNCTLNYFVTPSSMYHGGSTNVLWHHSGFAESNTVLDLHVTDMLDKNNYTLLFDLADGVFDCEKAQWLLSHVEKTMATMIDNMQEPIWRFNLLSDEHIKQLSAWGGADNPHCTVETESLYQQFLLQVQRTPNNIALKYSDASISYSALLKRVNEVADFLLSQQVESGHVVAVALPRSFEAYIAILGVLKIEAVYVPLDLNYPLDRLIYMLENSGACCIISNNHLPKVGVINSIPLYCIENENIKKQSNGTENQEKSQLKTSIDTNEPSLDTGTESEQTNRPKIKNRDAAYIMYTSGSSGKPKGVIGSHKATLNRLAWMWQQYPFNPNDICCQKTSLSFVDSIWEMFGPLLQGVSIVIFSEEEVSDLFQFVAKLESEHVSRMVLVPSLLSVILDNDDDIQKKLSNLRLCAVSGEKLPRLLAKKCLDRLPHCTLLNLYGSTEVSADVTYKAVSIDGLSSEVPIGQPLPGNTLHLLDSMLQPTPPGVKGEICVTGVGLALGYHQHTSLAEQNFVVHPITSERMYRTGDIGVFTESGDILYLGRVDSQVKISGRRIELSEIENVAMRLDGVKTAICDLHNEKWLALYYQVEAQHDAVSEQQLSQYIASKLPEFMVPQKLLCVDEFELLPNGKINKNKLPKERLEDTGNDEIKRLPSTETERGLAKIWTKVLGGGQPTLSSTFIGDGGASLDGMKLIAEVNKQFSVKIPPRLLFVSQFHQLAAIINPNNVTYIRDDAKTLQNDIIEPLFFGPAETPLFGVLHSPTVKRQMLAVLICPSIAHEYMRSYSVLQALAVNLAKQGYFVFRFDYYGFGDSSGTPESASVERWQQDINAAAQLLKKRSGIDKLCVLGSRLGVPLAHSAKLSGIEKWVMWDPVFTGKAFIENIKYLHQFALKDVDRYRWPQKGILDQELFGYQFSESLIAEINNLQPFQNGEDTIIEEVVCINSGDEKPPAELDTIASRYQLLWVQTDDSWYAPREANNLITSLSLVDTLSEPFTS